MMKLLEVKPEKRIRANEALELDFLKEKIKQTEGPLDIKYEESDFNNMSLNE